MGKTTKTIQPTGATITLPDYYEKADINVINTNFTNVTEAVNSLNSKIINKDVSSGADASMQNCTATVNTKVVHINSILNGQMIHGRVRLRGNITAIGSPAYSIVTITGLPDLTGFDTAEAIIHMREYANICSNTIGSMLLSGVTGSNTSINAQFQVVGGMSVNSWKVATGFYIDFSFILVKTGS